MQGGLSQTSRGKLLDYLREVWFNPENIVNIILSLADIEKYFRVWYNSKQEKAFIMEKPNSTEWCFVKTSHGLYYLDTEVMAEHDGTMLIHTIADNKSKYQVHTYHQALLVRKLQKMIGYPSTQDFIKYINKNIISNCPIRRQDILTVGDSWSQCGLPQRKDGVVQGGT